MGACVLGAHAWGGMLAGAAAYLGCQGIWRYLRSCTRTVVILEQLQLYSGKAKKKTFSPPPFATGTLLFSPSSDLFLCMLSWECSDCSASLSTCCGAYGPVVYTGYLEEGLVSSTDEASMLVVCICLHIICNAGMCVFIWFFPLFFPHGGFLERFFPMGMLATCPK